MNILNSINSAEDVKKLNDRDTTELCSEIRDFIITNVSKTGGHLSSNLGAVEITVALHRAYDSSKDRIVFDVGHQCYAHKIITGRRDSFSTLRQYGGIAGFPKPYEADDDAFIGGHASNSLSVALGMAKARTLLKKDYDVVALIGDGSLTGGLAYEGLVNAASSGEALVIIINDNNMSISKNVGGTQKFLQKMRIKGGYLTFKRLFKETVGKWTGLYSFVHNTKEWLKGKLLVGNVFTDMGFDYIGPVDGHNVKELETVLKIAKEKKCPVIIHAVTVKGKGYRYAEENPEAYHGVGPFDRLTGKIKSAGNSFSDVFGSCMCSFAANDKRIVAMTAAMTAGTGLDRFSTTYADRFFDVGIAEGHAVAEAAAMAKQGLLPVVCIYSSFLQRAFDMLIHDVALLKLHVVFAVDRAGLVGSDGETHHGLFDISYLSSIPNMTIFAPASFAELEHMLNRAIYQVDGPVAVRYPRGGEDGYSGLCDTAESCLMEGNDITLVGYGTEINEILRAAEELKAHGISAEVIKLNVLKPNKFPLLMDSIRKTGRLFVAEEVCSSGSIGYKILTKAAQEKIVLKAFDLVNMGEGIVTHGNITLLRREFCLDKESIVYRILKLYEQNQT